MYQFVVCGVNSYIFLTILRKSLLNNFEINILVNAFFARYKTAAEESRKLIVDQITPDITHITPSHLALSSLLTLSTQRQAGCEQIGPSLPSSIFLQQLAELSRAESLRN